METLVKVSKAFVLFVQAIRLGGCIGDYSGGGAMPSASGIQGEKATFGFYIHAGNDGLDCNNITSASGDFQFVDHGTGVNVAFHAVILDSAGGFADADENFAPIFLADYYVKGKKAGQVLVGAMDYGKTKKTDNIFVMVLDGPFAGYLNTGIFEKGNVTYTPDPLCQ